MKDKPRLLFIIGIILAISLVNFGKSAYISESTIKTSFGNIGILNSNIESWNYEDESKNVFLIDFYNISLLFPDESNIRLTCKEEICSIKIFKFGESIRVDLITGEVDASSKPKYKESMENNKKVFYFDKYYFDDNGRLIDAWRSYRFENSEEKKMLSLLVYKMPDSSFLFYGGNLQKLILSEKLFGNANGTIFYVNIKFPEEYCVMQIDLIGGYFGTDYAYLTGSAYLKNGEFSLAGKSISEEHIQSRSKENCKEFSIKTAEAINIGTLKISGKIKYRYVNTLGTLKFIDGETTRFNNNVKVKGNNLIFFDNTEEFNYFVDKLEKSSINQEISAVAILDDKLIFSKKANCDADFFGVNVAIRNGEVTKRYIKSETNPVSEIKTITDSSGMVKVITGFGKSEFYREFNNNFLETGNLLVDFSPIIAEKEPILKGLYGFYTLKAQELYSKDIMKFDENSNFGGTAFYGKIALKSSHWSSAPAAHEAAHIIDGAVGYYDPRSFIGKYSFGMAKDLKDFMQISSKLLADKKYGLTSWEIQRSIYGDEFRASYFRSDDKYKYSQAEIDGVIEVEGSAYVAQYLYQNYENLKKGKKPGYIFPNSILKHYCGVINTWILENSKGDAEAVCPKVPPVKYSGEEEYYIKK